MDVSSFPMASLPEGRVFRFPLLIVFQIIQVIAIPMQLIRGAVILHAFRSVLQAKFPFFNASCLMISSNSVSSFRLYHLRSSQAALRWLRIFFPGNACRLVVVPGQRPTIFPGIVGWPNGRQSSSDASGD
jgi:hypothetical protein